MVRNIQRMNLSMRLLLSLIIVFLFTVGQAEKVSNSSNTSTLEKSKHGVNFSMKQLFPDQVVAFYIGRGFTAEQIKPYAQTCVYTMTLRNDNATGRIHYVRNNWKVQSNGNSYAIKTNTDWLTLFKQKNVKASSLIAFRLAQIPQEQEYEPNGDWNQGMLSIDLPIGSKFDITVNWDIGGKPYEMKLQEVHCVE